MAGREPEPLFKFGEVPVEGPDVFGAWRFQIDGAKFIFENGAVYGAISTSLLPLATVPDWKAAVYFAMGFQSRLDLDFLRVERGGRK